MKRWSIRNASIWGAAVGMAYSASTALVDSTQRTPANLVGYLIGGAIGGVILFVLVATIRNRVAKA